MLATRLKGHSRSRIRSSLCSALTRLAALDSRFNEKARLFPPSPLAQAFGSTEFKLKSGINKGPSTGYPHLFRFKLELGSAPRGKSDCILLSIISLARSSLTKIQNQNGLRNIS
jgi:hypothetical protein